MKRQQSGHEFSKYILLSILGMLGSSGTILADTFFVANRLGTDGLAALNLSISVFGIINGLGMMIGIGGATRYAIFQSQSKASQANRIFSQSVLTSAICGILLCICGVFFSGQLACLLGADSHILPLCSSYLRIVLCFAPFFILNHVFMAFIRNDGNPKLAMAVMLTGSLFNILLDYLFLYPLHAGLSGAALATGLAPVIGLATASCHIITGKNQFHFVKIRFSLKEIQLISGSGISALINEVSAGFVLIVFNLLILRMSGNTGVAAYGIIANLALIAMAVFTGISQGLQPLISRAYGIQDHNRIRYLYKKGMRLSFFIGILCLCTTWLWAETLVALFNKDHNPTLQVMAEQGLKLYFTGFLFIGGNFVNTAFYSAVNKAKKAFVTSFFRGFSGILVLSFLFSSLYGLTGLWVSFAATECATLVLSYLFSKRDAGRSFVPFLKNPERNYS